jgi:hypothetical protein
MVPGLGAARNLCLGNTAALELDTVWARAIYEDTCRASSNKNMDRTEGVQEKGSAVGVRAGLCISQQAASGFWIGALQSLMNPCLMQKDQPIIYVGESTARPSRSLGGGQPRASTALYGFTCHGRTDPQE